MKQGAQPTLSEDGQQTLDQYAFALQQMENLNES